MFLVHSIMNDTRGPWIAIPALIEVKETDKIKWHFYVRQKVIQIGGNFIGKRCVLEISTDKPEKNCQLLDSW